MEIKAKQGMAGKSKVWNMVCFILLLLGAITMIFPLLWMITVALKTNSTVFALPPQWIPKEFHWANFIDGTRAIHFWPRFLNSVIITVLSTIGQVISSLMVGYALSRIKFPGRKLWFYLIVGSMMLPGLVGLLPLFKLYSKIGWYDSWLPLIVPNFLGSPFYIFLVRQFMMTIPKSFDEAAVIDGANHIQILTRVLMPLLKPAIAVIVVMQVQASWNDYLNPLVYVISPEKWPLSVAVAQFINSYAIAWNQFMAADIIYMLPMLILFFAAQKYFMQGLGSLNNAGLK